MSATTDTDTYTYDGLNRATIVKDPDAILDYSWNWTDWLALVSDTISAISFVTAGGMAVASSSHDGHIVTAWISGGTVGTKGSVTCHITTMGGRQDDRTIFFTMRSR